ncbi:MAG: sugar transferase [Flavobacteriales bacterium]|nr:sugar transferase [Flavobacteriales bacterium]
MPIALLFIFQKTKDLIVEERSGKFFAFVQKHVKPYFQTGEVIKTEKEFNIKRLPKNRDVIVNLEIVNNVKDINSFFQCTNDRLAQNGLFICSAETIDHRKRRLMAKYLVGFNYVYYVGDFVFKRIFPKFKMTAWFYNLITNRRNHPISKSELLGRLVYNGFEIVEYEDIDNLIHVIAKKVGDRIDRPEPSQGLILRIKRIGKNGNKFTVYKLRTMHPYAEFIQSLVYNGNQLKAGGKFKNDFRITSWGRFFRKTFIDETPMLINLLKGDLGLVGVRPLSEHYLSLYPDHLKELRAKFTPGLVPPFYVHLPNTIEEIIESEITYLNERKLSPFRTNAKYLRKACYNIIFKGARSN